MQVPRRAINSDLQGGDTAQPIGQCGVFQRRNAIVRNHHRVAGQFLPVLGQEAVKLGGTHLLFAFDEEDEVARQRGSAADVGLDRIQVGQMLPLVVGRAAGIEGAVFNAGFERRGLPQFERLRRLHIVVAVDEEGGLLRIRLGSAGHHDGVAVGFMDRGVQREASGSVSNPLGCGTEIRRVLRLGADTRKAHVVAERVDELGLVFFEVLENRVHGRSGNRGCFWVPIGEVAGGWINSSVFRSPGADPRWPWPENWSGSTR